MSHSQITRRRAISVSDPPLDRVAWSWPLFGLALVTAIVSYLSYLALIRA